VFRVVQVFMDWNGAITNKQGKLALSDLSEISRRIYDFVEGHAADERKRGKPCLKEPYKCNKQRLQGLDHALKTGLGWGLEKIVPLHRPLPLAEGERRFWIATTDDGHGPPNSADRVRRACIKAADGSTRLENCYEPEAVKLIAWSDQCAAEWVGRVEMNYGWGLRFQEMWDITHRRADNVDLVFSRCKLNSIKVEFCLALNFMHAPYRTSGNRGRLCDVAHEYFQNMSCDCPLFRHLYEDIAVALADGRRPSRLGDEDHVRETWERLKTLECYGRGFALTKMGRFHDFVSKVGRVQRYASALLLPLLYIGIHDKWFSSISETPLVATRFKPLADGEILPPLADASALAAVTDAPIGGAAASSSDAIVPEAGRAADVEAYRPKETLRT
jgi:hypothetical protein